MVGVLNGGRSILLSLYSLLFHVLRSQVSSQKMRPVQPFWESKNVAQIGGWRVARDVQDPVEAERQPGSHPCLPMRVTLILLYLLGGDLEVL